MALDPRQQSLADFAKTAEKVYGKKILSPAHRMGYLDVDRCSTGSISLDHVMGGGLPRGRVTLFWGKKSSGKTTNVLKIIGKAQNLCRHCWRPAQHLEVVEIEYDPEEFLDGAPEGWPTHEASGICDCVAKGIWEPPRRFVVDGNGNKKPESDTSYKKYLEEMNENSYGELVVYMCDAEGSFDGSWATANGVDLRRLFLSRPEYAEQAIDLTDTILQTGAIDLVAIDSLAALTPMIERTESTEKEQRGGSAKLINKACRKWVSTINDVGNETGLPPTMLWINQERQKMGASMFEDKRVKPGGEGQGFATSIEVYCWSSKKVVEEKQVGSTKEETISVPVSIRINFKCEKNKTAPPHKKGFFNMSLRDDPSTGYELADVMERDFILGAADRFGIMTKEGSRWWLGTREFKTKKALREAILNDPDTYEDVRSRIIKRLREM